MQHQGVGHYANTELDPSPYYVPPQPYSGSFQNPFPNPTAGPAATEFHSGYVGAPPCTVPQPQFDPYQHYGPSVASVPSQGHFDPYSSYNSQAPAAPVPPAYYGYDMSTQSASAPVANYGQQEHHPYSGYDASHHGGGNFGHHGDNDNVGYQDYYGKKYEEDGGINDGAYAYTGGKSEPYGARGTAGSKGGALFDDYGRSIGFSSSPGGGDGLGLSAPKITRAVPKVDAQEDVAKGIQKFRVKLLAEGIGSNTDVLCQVGLDGIRMLDPNSNKTLRIYPLDTITRWEVLDSSIFAFWSKSSVDLEPKRIRLQSNRYTSNSILDTVTAATVQFKEIGGSNLAKIMGFDANKLSEQPGEKKKAFDWMNFMKPVNEEKDHWVPDEAVKKCTSCGVDFGPFNRRHHCRNCGDIFCDKCTQGRIALTADENAQPVRVCDKCMAEVTQRLSNAKEASARRSVGMQSHEDLAKKLKEEMEKNRKSSSGSSHAGQGRRTREVACPVCTVHLQVQVPTSGSETIECGVCQHPFRVTA